MTRELLDLHLGVPVHVEVGPTIVHFARAGADEHAHEPGASECHTVNKAERQDLPLAPWA